MRKALPILLAALLLPVACDRGQHPGNIGRPAPLFTIADASRSVDLSQFRGRTVVLNLWATWCAPCVEELPSLLALEQRNPSLAIIAISTDQDEQVYRRFLTQHHVDVLTVRDADGRINNLYGTVQIPETYIIDRNGILRRKFIGAQNLDGPRNHRLPRQTIAC